MTNYKNPSMTCIIVIALTTLLILEGPQVASGGSILFFMPVVSKSIRLCFMPVAAEMGRRGHEVVVITQHPDKKPNPNITEITVDGKAFNDFMESVSAEKLKTGGNPDPPILEMIDIQLSVSPANQFE